MRLEGAGELAVHAPPFALAEKDVIPSSTRDHSGERRSRRLLSRAGELIKRGDGYEPAAHYMRGPGPKTLARSREAGQLHLELAPNTTGDRSCRTRC